jgi:hypothetical protein
MIARYDWSLLADSSLKYQAEIGHLQPVTIGS